MRSTFNLKEPKKQNLTSIRFIAYFKNENRKFVYSTGELINPNDWDFKKRQPKNLNRRTAKSNELRSIKTQLDRYTAFLIEIVSLFKVTNQDITIESIRAEFDKKFKRTKSISNKFFKVYDLFLKEKTEDQTDAANAPSTIKRYQYNKKLLLEFQSYSKKQLFFNSINMQFYNSFIGFCVREKNHSANTLRRNTGLFKTFMHWSLKNNHTYKTDFQNFTNIKNEPTNEIALTFDQVNEVLNYDFSKNKRLENVRDLFVFGCATGLRYSNYSIIDKRDISNNYINVRDKKNPDKSLSIPLNDFSDAILKKYNFNLPKISNQNFNKYIKEVFKIIGFIENTKKTIKRGKEIIETDIPMYQRISSHTSRRSFITIMKNNKVPDRIIMGYTGHKNLEIFNSYYRPNQEEKSMFMKTVWNRNNNDNSLNKNIVSK